MSKFPSIEEFDKGQVHATKVENENHAEDLLGMADAFFAREQPVVSDKAEFFPDAASQPTQHQAMILGCHQGIKLNWKLTYI
jgi:hypothetical protein